MDHRRTGARLAGALAVLMAAGPSCRALEEWDAFQGYVEGRALPARGDCLRPPVEHEDRRQALIVHDESDDGLLAALAVGNLLGHFPEIDVRVVAAAAYGVDDHRPAAELDCGFSATSAPRRAGCGELLFYIGAEGDELPPLLIDDVFAFEGTVVWLGSGLRGLVESPEHRVETADGPASLFEKRYGFTPADARPDEGYGEGEGARFYRTVRYARTPDGPVAKLDKWFEQAPGGGAWEYDPRVQVYRATDPAGPDFEVRATIEHSGADKQLQALGLAREIPYVLRSDNLWVVADLPFSYMHRGDRYLVLADLMHEFVGIDHPETRSALFRLEDVHPFVDPQNILDVGEAVGDRPWNLALVPAYADPFGVWASGVPTFFTMNHARADAWREAIDGLLADDEAPGRGARIVMHGYTHQTDDARNGSTVLLPDGTESLGNGVTGTDYEFWDYPRDRPVPGDSYAFVRDRLARANWLLQGWSYENPEGHRPRRDWSPWAFEVPHYMASAVDYLAFSDFFCATYHEGVQWAVEVEDGGEVFGPDAFFAGGRVRGDGALERIDWDRARVGLRSRDSGSQFYPYPIHRDMWGQFVAPETLENLAPAAYVTDPLDLRSVEQILGDARLNRDVNRCAWASVFFHPHLAAASDLGDGESGLQALERILTGIEELGFTFVQAADLAPE